MIRKFLIFLTLFLLPTIILSQEIKILYKVNDEIITSYDVSKEIEFMKLNSDLSKVDYKTIFTIAENSLIREKIKKDEVEKKFEINYEIESNSNQLNALIKNFYLKIGFDTEGEFTEHLNKRNIGLSEFKIKFIIEKYWNKIIFEKYISLVDIDEEKIKSKVQNMIDNNSKIQNYFLSEIVFSEKDKNQNEKKLSEIKNSIENVGFKETAILYSLSETAKIGGVIGWVNENQISNLILDKIKFLEIGKISEPIITSGGTIILKVENKELIEEKIDKKKEIEKMITFEKNRILNEYSTLYFKELENKAYVKKL
ncbi:PPIC-like rotamase family protein [alpha proteobacterium HIMB5]|nr:PPIC-like rotamase family protein [alpha proteobacterium HIMB5]